jgi:hypothetical protein
VPSWDKLQEWDSGSRSDMSNTQGLSQRIVLGAIEGKNRAIHAHDGIVWKVRSGFLALLFGGWSILLTGIVEGKDRSPADYRPLPRGGDSSCSASGSHSARAMSTAATSGASSGSSTRSIDSPTRSRRATVTISEPKGARVELQTIGARKLQPLGVFPKRVSGGNRVRC